MSGVLDQVRINLLRLNATGLSARHCRRMAERLADQDALSWTAREWTALGGVPEEIAARARARAQAFDCQAELRKAEALKIDIIFETDARYPDLLKSIPDAPVALYARGLLAPGGAPLAFVGSRRPTPYGRRMAQRLAGEAAAQGALVVSGMARGIDTEAHRAALEAGGRTWAVWGSGLDQLYPPENAALAERIAETGCLISEYPLGAPPIPENFPRRNRIVSGLSWATIVVEGEINSGSLITARLAGEQGRLVCAVPGPADSRLSDAPHLLISEGAKLLRSIKEIWDELPSHCRPAGTPQLPENGPLRDGGLADPQEKILEWLGAQARTVEELSQGLGLSLPRTTHLLFEMELQDLVTPVEGQRYAKR